MSRNICSFSSLLGLKSFSSHLNFEHEHCHEHKTWAAVLFSLNGKRVIVGISDRVKSTGALFRHLSGIAPLTENIRGYIPGGPGLKSTSLININY